MGASLFIQIPDNKLGDDKESRKDFLKMLRTATESGQYEAIIVNAVETLFSWNSSSLYQDGRKLFEAMENAVKDKDIALLVTDYENILEVPHRDESEFTQIEIYADVLSRTQANIYSGANRIIIEDICGHPLESRGLFIIDAERRRQQYMEGYDSRHDAQHVNGELANGAASYAMTKEARYDFLNHHAKEGCPGENVPQLWPFDDRMWKPCPDNRIHELAKAGAMIAAEIDRLLDIKNKR